jgi:hypothetical protein
MRLIPKTRGTAAFCFAILMAFALSLSTTRAQAPQRSPRDDGDAAEQRWSEYLEMLQDRGSAPRRMAALRSALEDPNPGVRSNAIWFFVRPSADLPIEVVTTPGGTPSPADAPRPEVAGLRWDDNTRSFTGITRSHGGNGRVEGRVVGAELRLRFFGLYMPAELGAALGTAKPGTNVGRNCQVTLAPSAAKDALEGRMNCDGFSLLLPLRMPLG